MTSTSSPARSLRAQLDLVEIKPGVKFSLAVLQDLLPDVETTLFFAKVYELNAQQLGQLLHQVHKSDLTQALFNEGEQHSNELQSYVLDVLDDTGWIADAVDNGTVTFGEAPPAAEILPHVWKDLEVTVAQSIKDVAAKLESVVGLLPSKEGSMVFSSMRKFNAKRPTIGDFRASISHVRQKENLLILDVSGSVNEHTVRSIVNDVVALSYTASAHMAIVSNTTTYWSPGSYSVDNILEAAQYGGTHYETLAPLFDREWGTVITVADYDSSPAAKSALKACVGRIDQVVDISLVNRPTFLAECVGQLAADVKPILIGSGHYVLV